MTLFLFLFSLLRVLYGFLFAVYIDFFFSVLYCMVCLLACFFALLVVLSRHADRQTNWSGLVWSSLD